ncbi:hypothetical protein [Polaromonas sp.]|uniref:hypothetical protein n=1 Tax=Polaromonas sp. TaxID=1869339 RepID=UPI002FC82EB5
MKRCRHLMPRLPAVALTVLMACASLFGTPATAQSEAQASVREFPKAALRGELVVLAPPEITMNGAADRLSPGARIRDSDNKLVLTGQVINQRLLVNYLRDNLGQVQQVWILNSEEAKEKRAGLSHTNIIFGSDTATTPEDDGKTPYKQLPRYKQ